MYLNVLLFFKFKYLHYRTFFEETPSYKFTYKIL